MKKILAFILALVMILSMVACGAKEEPAEEETKEEAATEETAEATEEEAEEEEPAEEETTADLTEVEETEEGFKQDVVIGMGAPNLQMDVQEVTGTSDYTSHQLSHDTLFKTDEATGELIPWLVESYEIEDTSWVLKLKEGIEFHDGSTFDAYDVEFTLNRGLEHAQTQGFYGTLTWEVVDDYTIKISTEALNMDLGPRFANIIFGSMLSKESCEADPDNGFNIGTGAFKFVEFMENSHVKYARSENYWGEPVNCETIELRYYAEPSARLIALQNGEIDVCISPATTELEFVREDEALELVELVGGMSAYLSFNTEKEPYSNLEFRQAVAYAIDKQALIDIVCNGYGTVSNTIYGPNSVVCADDVLAGYPFDLEKAKELIAKNGWEGFEIKLLTNDSTLYVNTAMALQPMLMAAGFNCTIEQRGQAEVKTIRTDGGHEIMLGGFSCSDYPDSYSSSCSSTGSYNFARFKNDQVDEMLKTGLTMTDWNERVENYHGIAKIVFDEECYYAPLFRENANIAIAKGVSGFYARCDLIIDFTNIAVPVR